GVDIKAGDDFVEKLKLKVRSTYTSGVVSEIGAFSGLFDGRFKNYKHPLLVASTDGVGTKLKVAFMMNKHNTIGEDLVNHCVNDIAVCGATPLFFLDYFAAGKLNLKVSEEVLDGIIRACRNNECALIGGETAEMPGIYHPEEYDLAGTIIGVVEKSKLIDGSNITIGDNLIAIPSSG
ncbi:MAG: phosphoribosylformylglycinamidine cyclo-ligase, partial [Bacteroidetes bacterium]|nr:phosphoribosylformylglycinamidine cyclo-ligase [Bacteroidota bacterium]